MSTKHTFRYIIAIVDCVTVSNISMLNESLKLLKSFKKFQKSVDKTHFIIYNIYR